MLDHRRGDLGRGAAAVPGALGLPRGDLPHLLLQPAARRRRHASSACSAWSARTPSGSSASAGWRRCATSARTRAWSAPSEEVLDLRRHAARPQPARPAVHADLPVRRRRQRRPGARRHAGSRAGSPIAPTPSSRGAAPPRRWPFARAAVGRWSVLSTVGDPFGGAADRRLAPSRRRRRWSCRCASRAARRTGFLVAALNRYRPLDEGYRGFVELVAGHIAAGVGSARSYQDAAAAGRGAGRAGPGQDRRSSPTSATSSARR